MSEIGIKNQCFGLEDEMTGITREQAANALAELFGTQARYTGGGYGKWTVKDQEGKTWFDTAERFGVELGSDDSIDLYATYHPETEQFSAAIHIRREHPESTETRPVQFLPSERNMILREMEQCAEKQHTSLKELYAAWKSEQGKKQTQNKKKEKKHQHER